MRKQGFTLIELLIVITIIGILAVALVPRISQGPARARDVQRKADLQNLASSMELYYSDYGFYPSATDECLEDAMGNVGEDLAGYLGNDLPMPPDGASATQNCAGGEYYYDSDGTTYTLAAAMETASTSYFDADLVTACDGDETSDIFYVISR